MKIDIVGVKLERKARGDEDKGPGSGTGMRRGAATQRGPGGRAVPGMFCPVTCSRVALATVRIQRCPPLYSICGIAPFTKVKLIGSSWVGWGGRAGVQG